MIEPDLFAQEFELLCERFARVPSQPVIARYHAFLEARLDSEQFQQAAITIFNQDQFWPSPQRFLDAVHGALEDQAAVEWSKLLDAHTHNNRAEVSSIARKVWTEICAAGQLNADAGDQRISFVRRDFMQTYRAHLTVGENPPGLLPAPTQAEKRNELEAAATVTRLGQNTMLAARKT